MGLIETVGLAFACLGWVAAMVIGARQADAGLSLLPALDRAEFLDGV